MFGLQVERERIEGLDEIVSDEKKKVDGRVGLKKKVVFGVSVACLLLLGVIATFADSGEGITGDMMMTQRRLLSQSNGEWCSGSQYGCRGLVVLDSKKFDAKVKNVARDVMYDVVIIEVDSNGDDLSKASTGVFKIANPKSVTVVTDFEVSEKHANILYVNPLKKVAEEKGFHVYSVDEGKMKEGYYPNIFPDSVRAVSTKARMDVIYVLKNYGSKKGEHSGLLKGLRHARYSDQKMVLHFIGNYKDVAESAVAATKTLGVKSLAIRNLCPGSENDPQSDEILCENDVAIGELQGSMVRDTHVCDKYNSEFAVILGDTSEDLSKFNAIVDRVSGNTVHRFRHDNPAYEYAITARKGLVGVIDDTNVAFEMASLKKLLKQLGANLKGEKGNTRQGPGIFYIMTQPGQEDGVFQSGGKPALLKTFNDISQSKGVRFLGRPSQMMQQNAVDSGWKVKLQ